MPLVIFLSGKICPDYRCLVNRDSSVVKDQVGRHLVIFVQTSSVVSKELGYLCNLKKMLNTLHQR